MAKKSPPSLLCPCSSGKLYAECCRPWHHDSPAPCAEALMRSRYTAYVLKLESYLLQTWHPETRPASLELAEDRQTKWLGLEVKRSESTGENTAVVEFVARYKVNGKAEQLHEISNFINIDQKWYYIDGKLSQ